MSALRQRLPTSFTTAPSIRRNYNPATKSFCLRRYNFPATTILHWHSLDCRSHVQRQARPYKIVLQSTPNIPSWTRSWYRRLPRSPNRLSSTRSKRAHGEIPERPGPPLTAGLLERIVREIRFNFDGLNLKMTFCVAFAAFLRSDEFTDSWNPDISQCIPSLPPITFDFQSIIFLSSSSKSDPSPLGILSAPAHNLQALRSSQLIVLNLLSVYSVRRFTKNPINRVKTLLLQVWCQCNWFSGHSLEPGVRPRAALKNLAKIKLFWLP
jgi:hypothetical protein